MKPLFSFVGMCFALALALLTQPIASAGDAESPVGTWETQWAGPNRDRTIYYLTFTTNLTWTGYGIALESFGPVTVAGTWGIDSKGHVVSGFTEFREDDAIPVILSADVKGANKLRGRATAPQGRIRIKGEALGTPPDISGSNWVGEVRTGGNTSFQSYTFTASTNTPGWFDITGTGVGQGGGYVVSGALIVTSGRAANGYLASDFGTGNTTSTWSFAGKFVSSLERATFKGRTDTGNDVLIRLTRE